MSWYGEEREKREAERHNRRVEEKREERGWKEVVVGVKGERKRGDGWCSL